MRIADRCRQTVSIAERALDGRLSSSDLEHTRVCAACARALERIPSFERAFVGSVRSLAIEPMPRRLLDTAPPAGVGGRVGRGATLAYRVATLSAAALLVVAVGVTVLPRPSSAPGASPAPVVRTEAEIVASIVELGFRCESAVLGPQASPPVLGSLCVPSVPRPRVLLALAVERDATGQPRGIIAKGNQEPDAGAGDRERLREVIIAAAGLIYADPQSAAAAEAWLRVAMPAGVDLVDTATIIDGVPLRLEGTVTRGLVLHVGESTL
jgi:hypothetical protein